MLAITFDQSDIYTRQKNKGEQEHGKHGRGKKADKDALKISMEALENHED